MASCASCVAPGYPEVYSPGRQTAGLVIAVLVFALSVIGFALYWCRRHERLFVARSSWTVYLAAINAIVIGTYAVREYVGEGHWPCIVQGLVGCWGCVALPACLVLRVIGTYAKHVRQRTLLGISGHHLSASEVDANGLSKSTWDFCTSMAKVDAILLRYNVHKSRPQIQVAAAFGIPWFVYYIISLIINPPLRTLGAVGCRDGNTTVIVNGVNITIFVALLLPFYITLLRTPDTLYLRSAIILEVICVPLILVWYLVAKLTPGFEVNLVSGNYAIIAYACLIFFVSTCFPVILSFLPHERAASTILLGRLGGTTAASDMVALSEGPTSTIIEQQDFTYSRDNQPSRIAVALVRPYAASECLCDALKLVAASRLVKPDVSFREAKQLLGLPGHEVSASSRALRVVGSLLITLQTGRELLHEELAREFCVEIVAFIVTANALRVTVEAFIAERKSPSCTVTEGANIDTFSGEEVALVNSNREVELSRAPSVKLSVALEFASLVERLTSLMLTFIVPSADMQVNLDSRSVSALTAAASAMAAAHAPSVSVSADDDAARIAASELLVSALYTAEKEIFFLLISGPLFHLVQRAKYAAWASKTLLAATSTIEQRGP